MVGPNTNPYTVALPAGTWVKVATAMQDVTIKTSITNPKFYLFDQVDTGLAAPANDDNAIQFPDSRKVSIESTVAKDFYCKAIGAAGEVIVWENCLVYYT